MHCAQTAEDKDTISFCVRQHHVSARSRYNLAYIGQLFPPQILTQSDPPPVDLTVGDIRSQLDCAVFYVPSNTV